MFRDLFPIVVTADLPRALGFYRDLLGFEVTYRFPEDGDPVYVALEGGGSHLGLGAAPDPGPPSERFSLWVYADDCDAAVERLRAGGAQVLEEPADQPWGERVAAVADPDGNVVRIGQAAG